MLSYVVRRLLISIPVYLSILLLVLLALNAGPDPASSKAGKHATPEDIEDVRKAYGLDKSLPEQYASYVWGFDLQSESWSKPGNSVGDLLKRSVIPSLAITLPALIITAPNSDSMRATSLFPVPMPPVKPMTIISFPVFVTPVPFYQGGLATVNHPVPKLDFRSTPADQAPGSAFDTDFTPARGIFILQFLE